MTRICWLLVTLKVVTLVSSRKISGGDLPPLPVTSPRKSGGDLPPLPQISRRVSGGDLPPLPQKTRRVSGGQLPPLPQKTRRVSGGQLPPLPNRTPQRADSRRTPTRYHTQNTPARIPYQRQRPRHPALWGHWTSYGPCSRTCDQGVKMRTRSCLQWTGERYTETHLTACTGINIDYKICQNKKCLRDDEDFRRYQCRMLSKTRPIGGGILLWTPYDSGKPCKLTCRAVGRDYFYSFGTVQDGTPCPNVDNHVCVHGECKIIGCDGHVGDGTRMDMCGVCNGRNETCSHIHHTYRTKLPSGTNRHRGYNDVITIPRGSTHFRFSERSRNSIAVMDADHRFVLNGHYTVDKPGLYHIGGTKVVYDRLGDRDESLQGDGPTTEDLHVMLLYREQNSGVEYEFWVPGKPSAELLNKTFDNAIPVDDVIPEQTTARIYATRPPVSKKTTLSDDQIWNMVLNGFAKERQSKNRRRLLAGSKKTEPDRNINEVTRKKKRKGSKRRSKGRKKVLLKNNCGPCKKVKDRNKQFCQSDFVSRVKVNGVEIFGNDTRYDIAILYTYRNTVPLLHREYVWVANLCKCPRLRVGREYIMMGTMGYYSQREIRLSVAPSNYVRRFSIKQDVRMQKLKRKRSKCKKKKKF